MRARANGEMHEKKGEKEERHRLVLRHRGGAMVIYTLLSQVQAAEDTNSGIPIQMVIGVFALMLVFAAVGIQSSISSSREESERQFEALGSVRLEQQRSVAQAQQQEQSHQEAVAQAIKKHPELAASQNPESLRKLANIINDIERDNKLVAEINAAKLTQEREEQAKQQAKERKEQQAKLQTQRAEAARAQAEEQDRKKKARLKRLAQMSPFKRLIMRQPAVTGGVALLLIVLVTGVLWSPVSETLRCSNVGPNADLSACDLTGMDLTGMDLTGANLSKANLTGVKLSKANLRGAKLTGAKLTGAVWTGATCPSGALATGNPATC